MTGELPADLPKSNPLDFIDHLVFGCLDLQSGCAFIEDLTGMQPQYGGVHAGRGTQNALLRLGPATYLEIVAPDPAQKNNTAPPWMPITAQNNLRLIGWAAKSANLDRVLQLANQSKTELGRIEPGSRRLADGSELTWTLTLPQFGEGLGVIPFFVDWGDSIHPAQRMEGGCQLHSLSISHPLADKVARHLESLETSFEVTPGPIGLLAKVELPNGSLVTIS